MRDPHRPREDDVLRGSVSPGDLVDLFLGDARLVRDLVPRDFAKPGFERGPAFAVGVEERAIDRAHFENAFGDAGDQGQVAADVRLDVERGDLRAEEHADRIARHLEVDHAGFDHRIDDDDLALAAGKVLERRHQPRVIAGRVAADHEDRVGLFEIVQLDRSGPRAEDVRQTDAARLMAVVRTVVDVVRAVHPREELQQEAGFVRTPAAEIPERFVGLGLFQLGDDATERVVPGDRLKILRALFEDDGLDESAARFELAGRKGLELGDAVGAPELGLNRPLHVGGHRLQALLADLGEVAGLVDHAARLTAHAERAGLAGVLGAHGGPELPELPAARLAGFPPGVKNRLPTAAGGSFTHGTAFVRQRRSRAERRGSGCRRCQTWFAACPRDKR